jgi:hypothetical protein
MAHLTRGAPILNGLKVQRRFEVIRDLLRGNLMKVVLEYQ